MISRTTVSALVISASALVSIALHESYRSDAYIPVPGDVPTIGFGTTHGVKPGDRTTPERALVLLLADADKYASAVRKCAPVPMYQWEFDAMLSATYNIGGAAFCKSTMAKRLNAGDYEGACNALLLWNKQGGKVLRGLVNRREAERRLCLGIK